jgi:hypothetical protein
MSEFVENMDPAELEVLGMVDIPVGKIVAKIHFHILHATEIYYFVQFFGETLKNGRFVIGPLLKLTNMAAICLYHERLIKNEGDRASLNKAMFKSQIKLGTVMMD